MNTYFSNSLNRWDDLDLIDFETLNGKTLKSISVNLNKQILFTTTDDEQFLMYHNQDCCESVHIEDVVGDWNDLIGTPILKAEESSNSDDPPVESKYEPDSYTWTYYKLATIKGYVDIRWFGESNGYYSEDVSFYKVVNGHVDPTEIKDAVHYNGHSSVLNIIPPETQITLH